MTIITQTKRVDLILSRHELLNLNNTQPGMAIECKQGVIWVTCSGDYRDHMLSAGEKFMPVTRGDVLIEALNDARVHIKDAEKQQFEAAL